MPGKIRKAKNKNCYSVKWGNKLASKCTSRDKATKQLRLLYSLEHK